MDIKSVSLRLWLGIAIVTSSASFAETSTIVTTSYGKIQGVSDDETISFRGIPYAKPPIENRRWMPPEAPYPWPGVRDGSHFASSCPQPTLTLKTPGGRTSIVEGKEDCLYLNVWVPQERAADPLPVMVFLHGGGFASGSGVGITKLDHIYTGEKLAPRANVIMVSLNYRIGALGFLAEPSLSATSTTGTSGNYGLLDQIAALQWVRSEISQFGGDPQNVTVFGESAGAMSICSLLAQQKDPHLFHKAIMQSGACQANTLAEQSERGEAQAKRWGCDFTDPVEQVACLKSLPLKKVIAHQDPFSILKFRTQPSTTLSFAPVVDGDLLTEMPLTALTKRQNNIPVIVGNNGEEFPSFTFADVRSTKKYRRLLERFGYQPDEVDIVARTYDKKNHGSYARAAVMLGRDVQFTCPNREIRAALRQNEGAPVYGYIFDMPVRSWADRIAGAFHGVDLLYVFQKIRLKDVLSLARQEEEKVAAMMANLWGSFAHSGRPQSQNMQWEPEQDARKTQMRLNANPSVLEDFQGDPCDQLSQLSVRVQRF